MSDNTIEPTREELESFNRDASNVKAASAVMEKDIAPAPASVQGYRSFVADQHYANSNFLVKAGDPKAAPITAGTPLGLIPLSLREGDVFAEFANGVLTTDNPIIIEWCESHTNICRPASDPRTRAWHQLKSGQTPLNNREAIIDGDMNVDEMMFGENTGSVLGDAVLGINSPGDITNAAQAVADKANLDAASVDPSKVSQHS